MNAYRSLAWLFPLALVASACGGGNASTMTGVSSPSTTTPSPSPAVQAAQPSEHASDPADALLRATESLQLTDAQRATARALEGRLSGNQRDVGSAFRTLRADVAAQIRAGLIEPTKLQTDETVAVTALKSHVAKEAETLAELHATLDASQRRAVVAAVRAREPGRTEAQGAPAPAPSAEDAGRTKLDRITRELDLDPQQQQQLSVLLAGQPPGAESPAEDRQRRIDALLAAFDADTFDPRAMRPAGMASPGDMVRDAVDREIAFLSKVVPILRPDQRERLATRLESRGMRDRDDRD